MATYRGVWTPDHRAQSIHQYVPFEVPAGAEGVEVTLSFDRGSGVLDLGCFDPQGFRGYSGGARNRFAITGGAATPGYLPGPVTAGEWEVLIGLYRIPPEGLPWRIDVEVGVVGVERSPARPALPDRPPQRDLPAPAGHRWMPGDLHTHTVHSDGTLGIEELAALARGRGLRYLAVSDHNTVSHHSHLAAAQDYSDVLLIPAQEVTTDSGHANCFGDVGWVDFRTPADSWLAHAEARGGLLSLNHPLAWDLSWRQPLSRPPHLVEVWHATWDRRGDEPLRWWARHGGVPVGGSDLHNPAHWAVGVPTTWTLVEEGAGAAQVLGALAAGRVAISAGPAGAVLFRHDDAIVVDGGAGMEVVAPDGRRTPVHQDRAELPAGAGLHRLVGPHGVVAALTP